MVSPIEKPSFLKKWLVAARPWALPASTMPVIFGTALAVIIGGFSLDISRFLLALLAMMILHTAANMLSDVFDYRRGLEKNVTPVSGAIVRGWLSVSSVKVASVILFIIGSGLGIYLVLLTGTLLLYIGVLGVAIGLFYTILKYNALGDLAVFLNFGILGSLGAWVVQSGSFSWIPVLWTIPMAMLVAAILHANNWRDTLSDRERHVTTIASILGDLGSLFYYIFLIFGPFFVIAAFMILPRLLTPPRTAMPFTFLVVLVAVPQAFVLLGRALRRREPRRPLDFVILDGATANFNLTFGLLCTIALIIQHFLQML